MFDLPFKPFKGLIFIFGGILLLLYAYELLTAKMALILVALFLIVKGSLQLTGVYALRKFFERP